MSRQLSVATTHALLSQQSDAGFHSTLLLGVSYSVSAQQRGRDVWEQSDKDSSSPPPFCISLWTALMSAKPPLMEDVPLVW